MPVPVLAALLLTVCPQLDRYVAPLRDIDVFSGVVLVARGDSVLCERSYGLANREFGIPIAPTNEFRIASISKSFTNALLGVLIDRGQLTLSDTLSKWLPQIPSADRITLRMLVEHSAGIPSINSIPYDEEAIAGHSLRELVDTIARRPLDFAPGSKHSYSNGGYAVLARVIEIVTKRDYATALRQAVLEPLGLRHTLHEQDGAVIEGMVSGYMPAPDSFGVAVHAPYQEMATKTGGGSLVSNAHDLLKWFRAIGRDSILTRATWAALFPGSDSMFAAQGRCPGFNAYAITDRRDSLTVIVLANNYAAGMVADIGQAALRMARGEDVEPPPWRLAARPVPSFALGAFDPISGLTFTVKQRGDDLVVYAGETPVDLLLPQPDGRYLSRALWSLIEFSADSMRVQPLYRTGSIAVAKRDDREVYDAVMHYFRKRDRKVYLSPVLWRDDGVAIVHAKFQHTARYFNGPVIDVTFKVRKRDGAWVAKPD